MAVYASNPAARGPFASAAPPGIVQHAAPAGTFLPGTKVQCGTHRVIIDRYLSEGGFAHVYVVTLPRPVDGNAKAVLKRVAVPDKEHLASMRTEVETMKRLRGHNKIVKYIDSHASQLKGGGYEVFLLMEFCQGGGLIDFMNTRLQNRLTEPEILKIFTDIAEGVAAMHYLKPVLLHRDLKVENVLISLNGTKKTFKLCDFGSAALPKPAATNAADARLLEDDIQRHTTMQYRSPEMIDVYRKMPIDEKSDIWALGVFLYKLCYYTTPFEDVGQSAILNAKFKYPAYPRFSDQLKLLIATMLRERPGDRPNIYQVLQKACQLDGRELPVRDIYAHRSQSESRKDTVSPPSSSQSNVGATLAPPTQAGPKQEVPDIAPMRRGRPTKPVSHHGSAKPSPSPLRMLDHGQAQHDPFAALDGKKNGSGDELSSKFPTLDEFSLMTDGRKPHVFDAGDKRASQSADPNLAQRVTNALADQAFARAPSPPKPARSAVVEKPTTAAKPSTLLEKTRSLEVRPKGRMSPPVAQKSSMVSTGVSASPPPSATRPVADKPVWKVPIATTTARPASTGQAIPPSRATERPEQSRLARLLQQDASDSQGGILEQQPRSPTSSRPSLEGGRPSAQEIDLGLSRSKSLDIRKRPATVNLGAHPTHIKDREIKRHDYESNFVSAEPEIAESAIVDSDATVASDLEWLRAREEEERERMGHHRKHSSHQSKRTSLPHAVASGTKNILTGRFGDAFKKFEGGRHSPTGEHSHHLHFPHRSSSIDPKAVAAPEVHDAPAKYDELALAETETEELSPEMRRELEKLQLEAEEKRVAQAAAAYRQRVASRGGGPVNGPGVNRAATIQSKMQSLMTDNNKPAQKTATGYGKYTNEAQQPVEPRQAPLSSADRISSAPPSSTNLQSQIQPGRLQQQQRPNAPSKPQALRNAQIVTGSVNQGPPVAGTEQAISPEEWEKNFSQRYPSLSGLEMVERDIDSSKVPAAKIREI
ncbi:Serine/threonine-protein kinase ppk30 [Cyphellophora attinorum]|uniref:non-specific serine/threonine protein kinase n=1 Tax=Cyphellophora attinorum TaxID=1664694 RepID=A0A0N1H9Z2_9EURO|nr:Serine/threonine-protein kinase ppk30 [Phialophora attinorum]KPI44526.1 Serine/threonine-protein kinase ppk30 [Phialophora attinorum]